MAHEPAAAAAKIARMPNRSSIKQTCAVIDAILSKIQQKKQGVGATGAPEFFLCFVANDPAWNSAIAGSNRSQVRVAIPASEKHCATDQWRVGTDATCSNRIPIRIESVNRSRTSQDFKIVKKWGANWMKRVSGRGQERLIFGLKVPAEGGERRTLPVRPRC